MEITQQIRINQTNKLHRNNQKVTELIHYNETYTKHVNKLVDSIAALEQSLLKQHILIADITFHKTGNDDNKWSSDDSLYVSIRGKSSGKFKFISHKGYTSSGSGRNDKQLNDKKAKIQDKVFNDTAMKIHINQFSLEIKDNQSNDSKTILIETWIKC